MVKDDKTANFHIQGILKAQVYIQKNLDNELSLKKISQIAGFSPYHFHRIFHAYSGESLNNYVRRLRMEKSAGKVKYEKDSITEIAMESGYETPSSFSSAFKKVIGKSPKEYRSSNENDSNLTNQPEEKINMEPTIINLEDMDLLFVRKTGSYQNAPKEAFIELLDFAKNHPKLLKARKFGIAQDNPQITKEENLRFDACLVAPKENIEHGQVGRTHLDHGKFATFKHLGSYETLSDTFDMIFKNWYFQHKKEIADRPMFLEYLNMELVDSSPDKLETLIYIPLKS